MTKTDVVNLALAKLGASLVSVLGDDSIPASHFGGILYQPSLERILRDFPWSFATKEEQLAQAPAAKSVDFAYSYAMPADFVRLGDFPDNDNRFLRSENFSRSKGFINTDESPALLRYVSKEVTVDEMDADFREALVVLLASELAAPLLQSAEHASKFEQMYLGVSLPKAKTSDARETDSGENKGPYRAIARSPLNQARQRRASSPYHDHI